ncbi:flagellin [Geodermatophilus normandii]|uniref:Flagellin n=1 Tax=Geodermatophilus normandii TaxID=1137989 RepID=A0A317QFA7_9ACTN|nr:flagellin [Geodermatophilus normandii]PWW21285.1 flagellin [Geodermatophilus normandii]PWW21286.1 flagellin [Geodermatophilus normandii]
MGLSVNTNIAAMNAYRNLSVTDGQMAKSLEKLSSGFRINRAADDAAGLAISEGLRSQIGGLKVAARNAQDGISVVQTAEGALTEVTSMLQRMNDLTVQYNNGTQNADSKAAIKSEYDQLKTEIGRIQTNTKFNGVNLFGNTTAANATLGTAAGEVSFQVGFDSGDRINVDLSKKVVLDGSMTDAGGATLAALNIETATSTDVQKYITATSSIRANLGALQNRFEHTINNLNTSVENLSAAESRIRDTDMAQEMTNFSRTQILSQAGTAMLAQANQSSQGILKLLG